MLWSLNQSAKRVNDTLFIHYFSQGCFHSNTEEMRIYRKSDSLFAEWMVTEPGIKVLIPPLTQYLSDSSIIAYSEFEIKGKVFVTDDGCTTREQFIINVKSYSFGFEDNACEFEGYNILKNKIFGESEIDSYYEKIYH